MQKIYKMNYKDSINKGKVEQFVISNTHPAIMDQEIWDKAQEIRAKRNERNKKNIH